MKLLRRLRTTLDLVYNISGAIAALFLVAILALIVLQMVARWSGHIIPGITDYAGYAMAGASFFAFAFALNHGAHIRVSLLLNSLGKYRWYGEVWCFFIGSLTASYFAWYAIKGTYWSLKLNDISQGLDATPIWIPQLSMSIGIVILAICFWDNLIRIIFTGSHGIDTDYSKYQDVQH